MDQYQVVAYDHRGLGDSEKPSVRSPAVVVQCYISLLAVGRPVM